MSIELPYFVSATLAGIPELLKQYEIRAQDKYCAVPGHNNKNGLDCLSICNQCLLIRKWREKDI